jgi:alkylation response protein AidB-like acyl-CoA dehydrogenase
MSIDFELGPNERQIVASVQDVLTDRVRAGADGDAVTQAAALGWLGLAIPEELGGAGFSLLEEVLLHRELGRHLMSPALLAGALAVHAALALDQPDLARRLMSGEARACLAQPLRGDHILYDAAASDWLLVWGAQEITCLPMHQATSIQPGRGIDRSVTLHRAVLAPPNQSAPTGAELRRRGELLVAAQLLGIAEAALDLAVDYAKLREQFGQPIGAFQAIKHRCADMAVRVRTLRPLVLMAALAERGGHADAAELIASARLLASRHALDNAAAGIQIHGAMGFTAECDAHRFLLRAHLLDTLGSTPAEREAALAVLP